MDRLTPFERALLSQFEALASACETSLAESRSTAAALSTLSEAAGARIEAIERRQGELSTRLSALATLLQEQNRQTTALVTAVNRLLSEQGKS